MSERKVFLGNGSDEVLAHAFNCFFRKDRPILFPEITYSFYSVFCRLYGIENKKIPLTNDLKINLKKYAIPNGGIIFANPNAPTGTLLSVDKIRYSSGTKTLYTTQHIYFFEAFITNTVFYILNRINYTVPDLNAAASF